MKIEKLVSGVKIKSGITVWNLDFGVRVATYFQKLCACANGLKIFMGKTKSFTNKSSSS